MPLGGCVWGKKPPCLWRAPGMRDVRRADQPMLRARCRGWVGCNWLFFLQLELPFTRPAPPLLPMQAPPRPTPSRAWPAALPRCGAPPTAAPTRPCSRCGDWRLVWWFRFGVLALGQRVGGGSFASCPCAHAALTCRPLQCPQPHLPTHPHGPPTCSVGCPQPQLPASSQPAHRAPCPCPLPLRHNRCWRRSTAWAAWSRSPPWCCAPRTRTTPSASWALATACTRATTPAPSSCARWVKTGGRRVDERAEGRWVYERAEGRRVCKRAEG